MPLPGRLSSRPRYGRVGAGIWGRDAEAADHFHPAGSPMQRASTGTGKTSTPWSTPTTTRPWPATRSSSRRNWSARGSPSWRRPQATQRGTGPQPISWRQAAGLSAGGIRRLRNRAGCGYDAARRPARSSRPTQVSRGKQPNAARGHNPHREVPDGGPPPRHKVPPQTMGHDRTLDSFRLPRSPLPGGSPRSSEIPRSSFH